MRNNSNWIHTPSFPSNQNHVICWTKSHLNRTYFCNSKDLIKFLFHATHPAAEHTIPSNKRLTYINHKSAIAIATVVIRDWNAHFWLNQFNDSFNIFLMNLKCFHLSQTLCNSMKIKFNILSKSYFELRSSRFPTLAAHDTNERGQNNKIYYFSSESELFPRMSASENLLFFNENGTDPFVSPITTLQNIIIILFYFSFTYFSLELTIDDSNEIGRWARIYSIRLQRMMKKKFLSAQCWLDRCGHYLMSFFGLNVVIIKYIFHIFFPRKRIIKSFQRVWLLAAPTHTTW